MSVLEIRQEDFQKEVIESGIPVLVDFYADWCGPCKMVGPRIEELAVEYDGKCRVYKVNIDNSLEIASEYGIMSVPTVIFFKQGKVVDQFTGARPKQQIEEYIKKML